MIASTTSQSAETHPSASCLAYYDGRNSVWAGEKSAKNPYTGELADKWKAGRRHALAEERLDADDEWED